MKKLGVIFLLLLVSCSALATIQTVRLKNETSCELGPNYDFNHKDFHTTTPVTAYTFYFKNGVRTYYSSIPYDSIGQAPLSPYPGSTPPMIGINLGFAPSPGYGAGSFEGLPGNMFNNSYIVQHQFSNRATPALDVIPTDPCAR